MDVCIEYINRQTYSYNYTYCLSASGLGGPRNEYEYIYFKLHVSTSEDLTTKRGYAEIGIIDKEDFSLYPCKVKLGYVYIKTAEAMSESLNRYRSEGTLYKFACILYNKDFSSKRDFIFIGTVQELAGCCQVLEYYVNNDFDINTCQIDKLCNKDRHYASKFGIQTYTMLDIAKNIKFTDFIEYIQSAENKAYSDYYYSFRQGEYACDYWETLTFKTENVVFAEIVENILCRRKTRVDNYYIIENKYESPTSYIGSMYTGYENKGETERDPYGDFKNETINQIINESCRLFPPELFIICKLISG